MPSPRSIECPAGTKHCHVAAVAVPSNKFKSFALRKVFCGVPARVCVCVCVYWGQPFWKTVGLSKVHLPWLRHRNILEACNDNISSKRQRTLHPLPLFPLAWVSSCPRGLWDLRGCCCCCCCCRLCCYFHFAAMMKL